MYQLPGYNRRKLPTKQKEIVSMAQTGQITGVERDIMTIHPKVHAHVLLTQVIAKQGLIKYAEKGNKAILKELQQLHNTQALLPIKNDITYDEKKRELKYLFS